VIHHVQVAVPAGSEDRLREFYPGGGELHAGVEADFRPARKAHPAFLVDLDQVVGVLAGAGCEIVWADPAEIPGRRRLHTYDPVGNRLEFIDGP
jgi:hypothetical protein